MSVPCDPGRRGRSEGRVEGAACYLGAGQRSRTSAARWRTSESLSFARASTRGRRRSALSAKAPRMPLESVKRRISALKSTGGSSLALRSEERRVGKECRSRWWGGHEKKKRIGGVDMAS